MLDNGCKMSRSYSGGYLKTRKKSIQLLRWRSRLYCDFDLKTGRFRLQILQSLPPCTWKKSPAGITVIIVSRFQDTLGKTIPKTGSRYCEVGRSSDTRGENLRKPGNQKSLTIN